MPCKPNFLVSGGPARRDTGCNHIAHLHRGGWLSSRYAAALNVKTSYPARSRQRCFGCDQLAHVARLRTTKRARKCFEQVAFPSRSQPRGQCGITADRIDLVQAGNRAAKHLFGGRRGLVLADLKFLVFGHCYRSAVSQENRKFASAGGPLMPILEGVKCARCRLRLHGSGTVFWCPKCGVFDTRASIETEIAEQLHDLSRRNLLAKVRRVLDKIRGTPIRRSRITGAAYRFIPDEDARRST